MSYDFNAIRARHKLSDVVGRVVNLKRDGEEFRGLCPFHKEKTPSFTVVDAKRFFYCFGCGAKGDVIDFTRDAYNLKTTKDAIDELERGNTTREYSAPVEIERKNIYDDMRASSEPAPLPIANERLRVFNPKRKQWSTFHPSMVFPYYTRNRKELLGVVVRIETGGGKKVTPMLRWAIVDGKSTWAMWPFDKPRPLYIHAAKSASREKPVDQVLIVEGEKCADAGARLLSGMHVATWPGGGKAVKLVDWSRFAGRSILLWPDADPEGVATMMEIATLLKPHAKRIKLIAWDQTKAKGWDIADAEAEGWDTDKVIAWAKERSTIVAAAPPTSPPNGDASAGMQQPDASRVVSDPEDGGGALSDAPPPYDPPTDEDREAKNDYPFRILGHDEGRYYYFPKGSQQVVKLSASAHTPSNMLSLYPNVAWWEMQFPQKKAGFDVNAAAATLMDISHRTGIFDDSRVRGRGAWLDRARPLIHVGDRAIIDGADRSLSSINSRFIYTARPLIEFTDAGAATTADANKLAQLCARFPWAQQLSGVLLCGWIVTSMVCGVLRWRPHIWITGAAGSGKTTVVNEVVARMIGPLVERCDGTITEAAIRQHMRHDARPVLIDEFEFEGKADSDRVQAVLKLIRLSSSGSSLKRGSGTGEGVEYIVRSSFCLSSINTAASERADQSRISKLILEPMDEKEAEAHFIALMNDINSILTPEYAAAMFYRTIEHVDTLLKNIETFTKAAALVLLNRRAADQVAAMIAGYHLCHSTKLISIEDATAWVRKRTWGDHTAIESASDETKLLRRVSLITQRMVTPFGAKDFSVGELIQIAGGRRESTVQQSDAKSTLGRLGIIADFKSFTIANQSPSLKRYLSGTPWEHDWIRPLRSIEGTEAVSTTYFSPGFRERGTQIPLTVLDEHLPGGPQPPTPDNFDGCTDTEIPT